MSRQHSLVVKNGILTDSLDIDALNRAFRLGDGFFESMRAVEGIPVFWKSHWMRILAAAGALNIEVPPHYTSEFLMGCIRELCEHHPVAAAMRLRFTFFREGGGTYKPESNRMAFLLEATPLDTRLYTVCKEGHLPGVYRHLRKDFSPISQFKVLGNHVYIQAALWAQRSGFSDAFILNTAGRIIEATASNLFLVKGQSIYTPFIQEGCLAGVMRMATINAALKLGFECFEDSITEQDLLDADEVFLTNSTAGLQWVSGFREKRYFHNVSNKLIDAVNGELERTVSGVEEGAQSV